jgi:hypothetical protein
MKRLWAPSLLILAASVTLSCGSGNNINSDSRNNNSGNSSSGRQLQSITISQTANGQQVQFVATGTFSAPPTTVTPLPVMWGLQLYAPPPGNLDYTLTTKPYVLNCAGASALGPVSAIAPSDPGAPASGSWPFSQMTLTYSAINCP